MKRTINIIEYRIEKGSLVSSLIGFITKKKYSHSAMMIENTWYELNAFVKGEKYDFHFKEYESVVDFLIFNPEKSRTEAYTIPHEFTKKQISDMHDWWRKRQKPKIHYGYGLLFLFLIHVPLQKLMMWCYRILNKPYTLKIDVKDEYVCSVAVDTCVKEAGKFDLIPELSERVCYPGLFAEKYKQHRIRI